MTEADWLTGNDLVRMTQYVRDRATGRKRRLFACGCCRALWSGQDRPAVDRAVRIGEAAADAGGNNEEANRPAFEDLVQEGRAAADAGDHPGQALVLLAAACLLDDPLHLFADTLRPTARQWLADLPWHASRWFGGAGSTRDRVMDRVRALCPVARDVFGNPFRPPACDPRWRSADAVGLARGIYDDRAFDRLPILADALLDAGCDDGDLLAHCRSDGPHVRGCWVVDLVLGKG